MKKRKIVYCLTASYLSENSKIFLKPLTFAFAWRILAGTMMSTYFLLESIGFLSGGKPFFL